MVFMVGYRMSVEALDNVGLRGISVYIYGWITKPLPPLDCIAPHDEIKYIQLMYVRVISYSIFIAYYKPIRSLKVFYKFFRVK